MTPPPSSLLTPSFSLPPLPSSLLPSPSSLLPTLATIPPPPHTFPHFPPLTPLLTTNMTPESPLELDHPSPPTGGEGGRCLGLRS